jgi:transposase-like protein
MNDVGGAKPPDVWPRIPGARGLQHFCYSFGRTRERHVAERFERHRQPWKPEELAKLRNLAGKGMALRAIAKALTRSEESVKQRAKEDGLKIAKLR